MEPLADLDDVSTRSLGDLVGLIGDHDALLSATDGLLHDDAPQGVDDEHLRLEVLTFAHLAHIALGMAELPARRSEELQRDLVALRAECDRGRVRPAVVGVLVGSVVDDLEPALPAEVVRFLREARPGLG